MKQYKKLFSALVLVVFLVSAIYIPASAAPSWPILQNGSSGANVWSLQYLLLNKGYSLTVDGQFGSGTTTVVKSFQTANGLTSDGIVGSATWSKLIVTVQNGSSGNAVKAVQYQLANKYGYSIAVDGAFGSGTTTAVKSFQSANVLTNDGIVGPTTWQYLLGGTGGSSSATVNFASGVNSSVVSTNTINVIKEILVNAGLSSCTITSTFRTPSAQATAMYDNCESSGAQSQLDLYGPYGDQVIQVYIAGKNAGKSRTLIIQEMTNKIIAIGPGNVSNHCATESEYARLNIVDISMSSIANQSAFVTQLGVAKANGKLSTYLVENNNNCYHLEVPVP